MAETKTPGSRFDNETEHNPSQQDYDREFNGITNNYGGNADASQEDDAIKRLRESEQESGSSETGDSADSIKDAEENTYYRPNESADEDSKEKSPAKGRFSGRRKKTIIGGAIGGAMAALLGLTSLSPFGAFINLKEMYSDWSSKHARHSLHYRTSKVKSIRYFTSPDTCGAVAVRCKLKSGISDREISKLREAGYDIQDKDIATSTNGKKYLKTLRLDDKKGPAVTINSAEEFAKEYRSNSRIVSKFEKVASTKAMMWRGKQSLKKLATFGVKRSAVIGSGATSDEDMTKAFRQEVYGGGEEGVGTTEKPADDPETTADDNPALDKALNDLDGALQDQIDAAQADLVENGPHPDTVLDPSQLGSAADPNTVLASATKSVGKTAVMGAVGSVDTYCVAYKYLARLSYLSKLMKAAALIKYAGIFMVAADAAKSGEITPTQAAYIGTILARPSTREASKGKAFGESAGYTLITEGRISNPDDIARFTNATPTLSKIEKLKSMMSASGTTAGFCKKQQSWWGQGLTAVVGLGSTILSGGTSAFLGAIAKSTLAGVFFSVVSSYITPLILQYATGAVVPDPKTDPEGGYGAGNALAAGMGAMGSQVSRSEGMRPLTDDEFVAINADVAGDDAFFAQVEELNGETSVTSKVADKLSIALLPLTQSLASLNLFGFMNNSFGLVSNSQAQLVSPYTYAAQDNYRGELCTDEDYEKMKLATDAFCNPINAQPDKDVLGAQFDPDAVIDYMLNNKHIDQEGVPMSDDFREFIDVCINGSDPLISNGAEAELVGAQNTENCSSKAEKYQHFRFFMMDNDILDSDDAAVNDRLGIGEAARSGAAAESVSFTVASYNILQGINHFPKKCTDGESPIQCIKRRSELQAKIITGQATSAELGGQKKNPAFDIVGMQEVSPEQYEELKRLLPGYGAFPLNGSRINNQVDGAHAIYWNTSKFKLVDSGTAPGLSNVANTPNRGNITVPWVGLEALSASGQPTGQKVYFMSVHWPVAAYTDPDLGDKDTLEKGVRLAREWVQSKAGDDTPVMLVGDFNDSIAERTTYCGLTKGGLLQHAYDTQEGKNPDKACPSINELIHIDHIYATPIEGLTASNWTKMKEYGVVAKASDHSPVYATYATPGGTAVGAKVKVATYNIKTPGQTDGAGDPGDKWADSSVRIPLAASIIKDKGFDVVGLQEIESSVLTKLKGLLSDYSNYPDPGAPNMASLTPIFWKTSRFDLIGKGTYRISWRPCYGIELCTGVPWVKLREKKSGQEFYFTTAHFANRADGVGGDSDPGGSLKREASAKSTMEWVNSLPADANVILSGDYNSSWTLTHDDTYLQNKPNGRDRIPYCIFTDSGKMTNVFDAVKSDSLIGKHCPTRDATYRIDHIYTTSKTITVKSDGVVNTPDSRKASDHNPRYSDLVLEASSGGWSWPVDKKWWRSDRADFLDAHPTFSGTFTSPYVKGVAADIGVPPDGSPIYAMLTGKVVKTNICGDGDGMIIESDTPSGKLQIAYGHGTNPRYSVGQTVQSGKQILNLGAIGCQVSGGHLHVDMALGIKHICPQDVFLAMGAGKVPDLAKLTETAISPCGR